jgi:hypothetical protein
MSRREHWCHSIRKLCISRVKSLPAKCNTIIHVAIRHSSQFLSLSLLQPQSSMHHCHSQFSHLIVHTSYTGRAHSISESTQWCNNNRPIVRVLERPDFFPCHSGLATPRAIPLIYFSWVVLHKSRLTLIPFRPSIHRHPSSSRTLYASTIINQHSPTFSTTHPSAQRRQPVHLAILSLLVIVLKYTLFLIL